MKHIDVSETTFTNDTRTGTRTLCGLMVWRDEAVTPSQMRACPPSDGVCPECKAAVVELVLKKPRYTSHGQQIALDGMVNRK